MTSKHIVMGNDYSQPVNDNNNLSEDTLIIALTNYIASKYTDVFDDPVFAKYFPNGKASLEEIKKVWESFFPLLDNSLEGLKDVKSGILTALAKYCDNGEMVFSDEKEYDVALLEGIMKCILYQLDKYYYTPERLDKSYSTIDECVKELGRRAEFPPQGKGAYSAEKANKFIYIFDKAKEWRNSISHKKANVQPKPYYEVMERSIRAYFTVAVLYNHIKNFAAGIVIKGKLDPFGKIPIMVRVEAANNYSKELRWKNGNREIAKIPIPSSLFSNGKTAKVIIKCSASDYVSQEVEVEARRGEFPPSGSKPIILVKQGTMQSEEEERRRREEEERRRREEEERRRREEEERRRREEEERRRREEEKRRQQDEEERRRREEEERKQQEEEERRREEEEKRKRWDDAIVQEKNRQDFEAYKAKKKQEVDDTAEPSDNGKCRELIAIAKREIDNLEYKPNMVLEDNKEIVFEIVKKLRERLEEERKITVAQTSSTPSAFQKQLSQLWGKIKTPISIIILIVVLAIVTIRVGSDLIDRSGIKEEKVEMSQATPVPSLEGEWRVQMMDGERLPIYDAGATITAQNNEGTQYKMDIKSNSKATRMVFNFTVDRNTGAIISPELGNGHIEITKYNNRNKYIITFDKWILEK